jgi:hypothetical protein
MSVQARAVSSSCHHPDLLDDQACAQLAATGIIVAGAAVYAVQANASPVSLTVIPSESTGHAAVARTSSYLTTAKITLTHSRGWIGPSGAA